MLDIENVTNFKIEKSNSNKSTSNKNIRKINIEFIQLIHKHTNICLQNKITSVDAILTRRSIQYFDHFRRIRTSFFSVANKFDYSKIFAAELRFFFENDAVRFFDIRENFV